MTSEPKSSYALREAAGAADFAQARMLFEEYATALGVDLGYQGFAAELDSLAALYGAPGGCLILASADATPVACGAFRRFAERVCEMKRLYVRPSARGASLGRSIAERLIAKARALGYRRMLLDTLAPMTAAQNLYRSLGFQPTARYYEGPTEDTVYLKLELE
jgi:GNAT superfamily N-acetyltransferase